MNKRRHARVFVGPYADGLPPWTVLRRYAVYARHVQGPVSWRLIVLAAWLWQRGAGGRAKRIERRMS